MTNDTHAIGPQPGPQTEFLSSDADWVVYGGAAGGGKTYGLLLDPLRAVHLPDFRANIIRRTYPEIASSGGLWDQSLKLYPRVGGVPKVGALEWSFPNGAKVAFEVCANDKDLMKWQGRQADAIYFDEATHFTEKQVFYIGSRNRGSSGVKPYIRLTCNPDSASWLAKFIAWWIDQRTGLPIPERAGVKRYFCRVNEEIHWADTPDELIERFGELLDGMPPSSCAFIPSRVDDNPALLKDNPAYKAKLLAMREVDKQRLLNGNWLISDRDGTEWPAEYFVGVWVEDDEWPNAFELSVIAGDPATGKLDGDYSAAVFMGVARGKLWVDASIKREPVPEFVASVAALAVRYKPDLIGFEDVGFQSLLVPEFERWVKEHGLMPWPVVPIPNDGVKKEVRIRRLGGYLKQKQIRFRRSTPDNDLLVQQLLTFPQGAHDDGPDATEMCTRLLNVLAAESWQDSQDDAEQLIPV